MSSSTVTVAADSNALSQKITAFITAYNGVVSAGHTAAGYGPVVASNAMKSGLGPEASVVSVPPPSPTFTTVPVPFVQ